jgi:uncharacterized membrane protein
MTELRTRYAVPALAVESPTAPLELELLPVNGGGLCFHTNAATVIGLLREGLRDLEDGDLTRIAELYRMTCEEVREREHGA